MVIAITKKAVFFDIDDTIVENRGRELSIGSHDVCLKNAARIVPILRFCLANHLLGFITQATYHREHFMAFLVNALGISREYAEQCLYFNGNDINNAAYRALCRDIKEASHLYAINGFGNCLLDKRKHLQAKYLLTTDKGLVRKEQVFGSQGFTPEIILVDDNEEIVTAARTSTQYAIKTIWVEPRSIAYLEQIEKEIDFRTDASVACRFTSTQSLGGVIAELRSALAEYEGWYNTPQTLRIKPREEHQHIQEVLQERDNIAFICRLAESLRFTRVDQSSPGVYLVKKLYDLFDKKRHLPVDFWGPNIYSLNNGFVHFDNVLPSRKFEDLKPVVILRLQLYLIGYLREFLRYCLDYQSAREYTVRDDFYEFMVNFHQKRWLTRFYPRMSEASFRFLEWYYTYATGVRKQHFLHSSKEVVYMRKVLFNLKRDDFFLAVEECLYYTGNYRHSPWYFIAKALVPKSSDSGVGKYIDECNNKLFDYLGQAIKKEVPFKDKEVPYVKMILRAYVQLWHTKVVNMTTNLEDYLFVKRFPHDSHLVLDNEKAIAVMERYSKMLSVNEVEA